MTSYVALLRGINVGGHKLIKMVDLKQMFETIGLVRVQTYIQSGNVIFEASEGADSLRKRIEQQIEATFGFQVTVVVKTAAELKQIIAGCPFALPLETTAETLYVSLLAEPPTQKGLDRLLVSKNDVDDYRISPQAVYVLCRQSIRKSIFSNNLLEKKLGVPATTRNWQTMNMLVALADVRRSPLP